MKILIKTKKKAAKKWLKRQNLQTQTERALIQSNHKISCMAILREGMLQLGFLI